MRTYDSEKIKYVAKTGVFHTYLINTAVGEGSNVDEIF